MTDILSADERGGVVIGPAAKVPPELVAVIEHLLAAILGPRPQPQQRDQPDRDDGSD